MQKITSLILLAPSPGSLSIFMLQNWMGSWGLLYWLFFYTAAFQCPELFDIPNGEVEFSSRTPGSTATYTCDFGFVLQGDEQRVCMENETWSGEPPTCFRKFKFLSYYPIFHSYSLFLFSAETTCPDLPNPTNGIVDIQGNTPGGSAVYLCNPGLSLIGSSRRICNVDGTWSGDPPTCIGGLSNTHDNN